MDYFLLQLMIKIKFIIKINIMYLNLKLLKIYRINLINKKNKKYSLVHIIRKNY